MVKPAWLSRIREWMAIARDTSAGLVDFCLCIVCVWVILFLYDKGKESMLHAGMPPRTLDAIKLYAGDPFLVERLMAWGTVLACILLCIILTVSLVEGIWAVLRRI